MEEDNAQSQDLQAQFDELTQQKISLWNEIKDNEQYESTEQWQQIVDLDAKLNQLRFQIEGGNA